MASNLVITRFAPSPTGMLHIGGARTALYNWLWARKNKGRFILRIEDTDKNREVPGAVENIIEGLKWLALDWDSQPIWQSKRLAIYQKYAHELVEKGSAYYCTCSEERLKKMREEQTKNKQAPKYDGHCRGKNKKPSEAYVIRLKMGEGILEADDIVHGQVKFNLADVDDQVLLKSDGWPTYHLANVVDDYEMGVNYIIRGEEWLPSLPKHILLYRAFGWPLPQFAHLSLLLNQSGGKLSKREGATNLLEFKKLGYLPEAILNFIVLLGWNPKTTQGIFSLEELIKIFDLKNINKANPIFDQQKLDYLNGYYLRKKSLKELTKLCQAYQPKVTEEIVALEQERIKTLQEIVEKTNYFFQEPTYEAKLLFWKEKNPRENLLILTKKLEELDDFTEKNLEEEIKKWIEDNQLDNGGVLWPMRVALTGKKGSPGPFAIAAILGREKTLARLRKAIDRL